MDIALAKAGKWRRQQSYEKLHKSPRPTFHEKIEAIPVHFSELSAAARNSLDPEFLAAENPALNIKRAVRGGQRASCAVPHSNLFTSYRPTRVRLSQHVLGKTLDLRWITFLW